jgi:nucleoside-diphosphate-sugar epimerase
MKVLVIGANGFIGSHLCKRLLGTKDYRVLAADLTATRLGFGTADPNFTFLRTDITKDSSNLDSWIAAADLVIPLAGIATPACYVQQPLAVFGLNFEANLRIIESCARQGRRVIFPSSSEVYGLANDSAFDEETTNLVYGPIAKVRWIYASSKQLLERVIHAYGSQQGLNYTIFRPFNWFGPGLDDDVDDGAKRVMASFVHRAIRMRELPIVDGGHQQRTFLYIDDAIEALMRIIENPKNKANGRIFNVGHPGNVISIRTLAEMVIDVVACRPGFERARTRVELMDVSSSDYFGKVHQEISYRKPRIEAIADALGWSPTTSLRAGVEMTVDCYLTGRAAEATRSDVCLDDCAPRNT